MDTKVQTDIGVNSTLKIVDEQDEDPLAKHAELLKNRLSGVLSGELPNYLHFDETATEHLLEQKEKFDAIKTQHRQMLKEQNPLAPLKEDFRNMKDGMRYIVDTTSETLETVVDKTKGVIDTAVDVTGDKVKKTFTKNNLKKAGNVIGSAVEGTIHSTFPGLAGSLPVLKETIVEKIKSIPAGLHNILHSIKKKPEGAKDTSAQQLKNGRKKKKILDKFKKAQ